MSEDGSITVWIQQLASGDENAAFEIWTRYFESLVRVARKRRGLAPSGPEDESDVVISALDSFFRRARSGQFENLRDRNNLWPLLVTITERKAINQRNRLFAQKRGGQVITHQLGEMQRGRRPIGRVPPAPGPTPAMIAELNDELRHLFDLLDDPGLRDVATLRLQGYSNSEIAEKIQRSERTVENRMRLIRRVWEAEIC